MLRNAVLTMTLLLLIGSGAVLTEGAIRTLDIYWIDAEGGASTLIVTPAGESLLVTPPIARPTTATPNASSRRHSRQA